MVIWGSPEAGKGPDPDEVLGCPLTEEGRERRKGGRRNGEKGWGGKAALVLLWIILLAPDSNICRFWILEFL